MSTASSNRSNAARRAQERAALWRMTYEALYGPPSGDRVSFIEDELPVEELPKHLSRAQLVAKPRALRRLLGPVLCEPHSDLEEDPDFRALVRAATSDLRPRPATYAEAASRLQDHACDRLGMTSGRTASAERRALERVLAAADLQVVQPAHIEQREGVSKISKAARFCVEIDAIAQVIDPENWLELGPFFEKVGSVEGEKVERADGWHGLFEEKFVVAWSALRLQTYHTFLFVDYTRAVDRVRADYSLAYEVDDQIERDSGYIEVRRIPSRLGWCDYYAEKAMRFRSPQANLFAPMLMMVFLESGLSALEAAAVEHSVGNARKPPAAPLELIRQEKKE